jgi:hypothetical protein
MTTIKQLEEAILAITLAIVDVLSYDLAAPWST